jgi:hypothetical protein
MHDRQQPAKRRILVVANETAKGAALHEAIRDGAWDSAPEVLVTAPALNSRLRHWTSDEDQARQAAERRLRECLDALSGAGVHADGVVGDADPLQAIEDALHDFTADELVIATPPEERAHWLSHHVAERASSRFGLAVLLVVVDRSDGAEYIRERVVPRAREPTRPLAA